MRALRLHLTVVLLYFCLAEHRVRSVPTCIIIDTNVLQRPDDGSSPGNNQSSSTTLLRTLRMLDHPPLPSVPGLVVESIPVTYVDVKQAPSSSPLIDLDEAIAHEIVPEPVVERPMASCSLDSLNELETQMVVPFEFRRLRIEQPGHLAKFVEDEPREMVPDASTALYERRSDPDGVRFCRTCHDGQSLLLHSPTRPRSPFSGLWNHLAICDTIRCDADLLRANPRLVTEWGEVKPLDGGALYAPGSIFAVYAFGFGPHCKRCENNGQWSRYALPEFCAEIKFFGHTPTSTTAGAKVKSSSTTTTMSPAMKLLNKRQ